MSAYRFPAVVAGLALVAVFTATPVLAERREPLSVEDYTLFVDLPTAFAFIKLPTGWKFVGKLDASQLSHLPPGTVTSLLPPDDEGVRVAARDSRQHARR